MPQRIEGPLSSPEAPETRPSKFVAMLKERWAMGNFLCVGLDSEYTRIPEAIKAGSSVEEAMFRFNREIIDATQEFVCAFKPNSAFYENQAKAGLSALTRTTAYIHETYPGIPVILDAKRADIGNTNRGYVRAIFERIGADAVTVHPYLGREALQPFLERKDKGIIVLCRTSNPGADEFQDLPISVEQMYSQREIEEYGKQEVEQSLEDVFELVLRGSEDVNNLPFYQVVAWKVVRHWNKNGNCGLVVGATYPREAVLVRKLAPRLPFLIPGLGAQGGEVESSVKAVIGPEGQLEGIYNSSRGIIFASSGADFAEAARRKAEETRNQINQYH